jgi:hypothetical protein
MPPHSIRVQKEICQLTLSTFSRQILHFHIQNSAMAISNIALCNWATLARIYIFTILRLFLFIIFKVYFLSKSSPFSSTPSIQALFKTEIIFKHFSRPVRTLSTIFVSLLTYSRTVWQRKFYKTPPTCLWHKNDI